jgi:RNase P subunit RPR2
MDPRIDAPDQDPDGPDGDVWTCDACGSQARYLTRDPWIDQDGRRLCGPCGPWRVPGSEGDRPEREPGRGPDDAPEDDGPCPDCLGHGYVPDADTATIQACIECQATPDDDEAADAYADELAREDPYAVMVRVALGAVEPDEPTLAGVCDACGAYTDALFTVETAESALRWGGKAEILVLCEDCFLEGEGQ